MDLLSPGQRAHLEKKAVRMHTLRQFLADLYPEPTRLTLELGCGHGHFLASFAAAAPDRNFLGIDLISRRIELAKAKAKRRELHHLQFLKAEAEETITCLPKTVELEAVFMLFPDPWPKQRHWKNRMVQRPLLETLHRNLVPGGRFYFRTDHLDYFRWSRLLLEKQKLWTLHDASQWPHEVETVFQKFTGGQFHSLIAEAKAQE